MNDRQMKTLQARFAYCLGTRLFKLPCLIYMALWLPELLRRRAQYSQRTSALNRRISPSRMRQLDSIRIIGWMELS